MRNASKHAVSVCGRKELDCGSWHVELDRERLDGCFWGKYTERSVSMAFTVCTKLTPARSELFSHSHEGHITNLCFRHGHDGKWMRNNFPERGSHWGQWTRESLARDQNQEPNQETSSPLRTESSLDLSGVFHNCFEYLFPFIPFSKLGVFIWVYWPYYTIINGKRQGWEQVIWPSV